MNFDWQSVATGICLALAALVVLLRVFAQFLTSGGVGCQSGCSTCPSQGRDGLKERDFISLESLIKTSQTIRPQNPPAPR